MFGCVGHKLVCVCVCMVGVRVCVVSVCSTRSYFRSGQHERTRHDRVAAAPHAPFACPGPTLPPPPPHAHGKWVNISFSISLSRSGVGNTSGRRELSKWIRSLLFLSTPTSFNMLVLAQ